MTTLAAPTTATTRAHESNAALRWALAALGLGAVSAVALAAMVLTLTTTDDGKFQHTGDYFLTANGILVVLALVVLLPALRALQQGRDGRLGQAGIALAGPGGAALLVVFVHGLALGVESSLGPTYVLAALATIVGVILFAAGSWRTRLLPRWLLLLWMFAWAVGSMLPILAPGGFLLAAVYLAMAALLKRRLATVDARRP